MYQGLSLGIVALLFSAAASAETLPLFPGRSIQAAPCKDTMGAGCWRRAQTLHRFAAEASAGIAPVFIDVRLGWEGRDLLVRTKGLSSSQHIEVVIGQDDANALGTAQLVNARSGITRHALNPKPDTEPVRALRLILRDEVDGSSRVWAPYSDGDLTRPALLQFVEAVRTPPELRIDADDGRWTVSGPEGGTIAIQHRRSALPAGGKGIHPPWSIEVRPGGTIDAPVQSGWFDVHLSTDDTIQARHAVYWRGTATPRLEQLGMHPAPQILNMRDESPFVLRPDTTVCASHAPEAGQWLAEELRRLTGVEVKASCEGDASITLVEDEMRHPEGYRIQAHESGINISASSARGAFYGAVATADLVGFDAQAPAVEVEDWPALDTRIFFHEVTPHGGPMTSPEQVSRFITRVVARARFNTMILELKGGLQSQSHPALSRADAWTAADLSQVLDAARRFGITVIPTFNTPAHSHWIGRVYPNLTEDESTGLLCTRNPATKALVKDMLAELHEAFGRPEFVHIGHDEIGFKTHRKHEAQRCPRCEGTPRWQLLTEDLVWQHGVLAELGAKPMMWSDMLIREWHGKHGAMYRAADRIPEALRPDLHVISWGRVGDTVGTLVPKGYSVIRGNTGYADWKRLGLVEAAPGVKGEALAIFNPIPWSSFEGSLGETRLYHHWSNVVLAGATAWSPAIEATDINTSLMSLGDHPAYLPGYRAWPSDHRSRAFTLRTEPAVDIDLDLPETLTVRGSTTFTPVLFRLDAGEQEPFRIGKHLYGLSIIQAVSHGPGIGLNRAHNKSPNQQGITVGRIHVTYADDETTAAPLILGLNTNRLDSRLRGSMLFEGSGAIGVASKSSSSIDSSVVERYLYRADWHNPRPEVEVTGVEFEATHPSVTLWVAGIGMALTPAKQEADAR